MVLENVALCAPRGARARPDDETRRRDVFPDRQCRLTKPPRRASASVADSWALGVASSRSSSYQLWPSATPGSGPSNPSEGRTRSGRRPGARAIRAPLDVRAGRRWSSRRRSRATRGRNPFRFQPKAPPPEPPRGRGRRPRRFRSRWSRLQPAGPPPIALKFFGIVDGRPGKIAALSDGAGRVLRPRRRDN